MFNKDLVYIVTGCTGYVGNVFTKKLMENGCRVVGLARNEEKVKSVFGDNAPEIVYGDIRDKEAVEKLFKVEGKKVVIHTVAYVSIGNDYDRLYDITVRGTENVVEAAVKSDTVKFLQISSTEAIDHKLVLDKELKGYKPDPALVKSAYGKVKAIADRIVLSAVENHGLNASIIMLASVLGPGDYSNSHMTQMIISYAKGKLPASVKGGYNEFDVRDMANVLDAIVEKSKKGENYLFANKKSEINEILGYVSEVTGGKKLPALPIWVAYLGVPFVGLWCKITKKRPLYTATALGSITANSEFPIDKVVEEFGYSPRPLRETVIDHVEFLKEIGKI
jgi:dihydroflavonol-4-reductase